MKKKDIIEFISEVDTIEVTGDQPEKKASEIKKQNKDSVVTYTDEEGSEVEVKGEETTLDLNLLENELYEEIKNEELGRMSKKDIMEMISFSKISEDCVGYHFHGEEGEPTADDVEVTVKKIEEEEVTEDNVETKPKTKPKTAPTKTPRRDSPFNPPKKDPAPAKGEYEGLSPEEEKEIEDAIGVLDEGTLRQSIIGMTKSFLNV